MCGCARAPQPGIARIAILPGNILIGDPSSEWLVSAVQLVLQTDLSTAHSVTPVLAKDDSGAYLYGAKDVLRTTITKRFNRFYLQATVTDNSSQKVLEVFDLDGATASGILPLLNNLAKRINSTASSFSTKEDRALNAYVRAISSSQAQARIAAFTDAISIDPSFGLAYIALAELQAQVAPQALAVLLQTASSHKTGFTPFDRTRFDALLVRYSRAPLQQQQAAYLAVLQIAPNQADALVNAGSISFLQGNAAEGRQYLQRALELSPGNPAIRRALAEGLLQTRHFADAEKFFVGLDSDVTILPELAICVLLEGDRARANVIAERLFASISNSDVKILYRAAWLKLSGQSEQAMQLMTTAKFTQAAAAIAYSELAVWQMAANDFAAARQSAAKARQLAGRSGSVADIVGVLADANGPVDDLQRQVETVLSANEQVKQLVLGYGLFLGQHYVDAAKVWSTILQQSGGADLRSRAMLAGALTREGKPDQARQINVQPFVPEFGDLYASISFFEMSRYLGIAVR